MTFVVDTNVLVYATNQDCREHAACRTLVEKWRRLAEPWYVTWSIAYEFLRVVTHPRVLEQPLDLEKAWGFMKALGESRSFGFLLPTDRHLDTAETVLGELPDLAGNLIHDAHTAILMREHGVRRICTRDSDFHRFPWLEVVDPLRL